MLEFSATAVLDGLIHLAAMLVVCGLLYALLHLAAKHKFERNFFRTMAVVAGMITARLYMVKAGWADNRFLPTTGALFLLALVLLPLLLKTGIIPTLVAAAALIPLMWGMGFLATRFSATLLPEGQTFAEYSGMANKAIEKGKTQAGLKPTDAGVREVLRKGLDTLATLTAPEEREVIQAEFTRGMELFAERKAWMDSLTPAEKQAYRAEMAAFMAEQGLAEDRYSLAAIRDVNPTNLVMLASLFSELQGGQTAKKERIRPIPESVAIIAANLSDMKLSSQNLVLLRRVAELFADDEVEEAIAQARQELEVSQGDNKLAGVVLAALVQAESGLPVDQLLTDSDSRTVFTVKTLKTAVSNGRDKEAGEAFPDYVSMAAGSGTDIYRSETAEPPPPEQEDFIPISSSLAVVLVPSDPREMGSWIAASQNIKIKGFASLGAEIVVLREDGSTCRKGDDWELDYAGHTYHFIVEKVMKDKVALRSSVRAPVQR